MVVMMIIAAAIAGCSLRVVRGGAVSLLVCCVAGLCDVVAASIEVEIGHALGIELLLDALAISLSVRGMGHAVGGGVLLLLRLRWATVI